MTLMSFLVNQKHLWISWSSFSINPHHLLNFIVPYTPWIKKWYCVMLDNVFIFMFIGFTFCFIFSLDLHCIETNLTFHLKEISTPVHLLVFKTLPTFNLSFCAFRTRDSGTKSSFCIRMFKWLHGFSINVNATWGNRGLF